MKIERSISWFDKRTEDLVGEINIDFIDLITLKSIFKPSNDDDLHLVYRIDESNGKQLEVLLNIKFDFEKYIYEMGCYSV